MTEVELQILLALAGGDRHGYAILRDVRAAAPAPRLYPGTLYATLKRLLDEGLVEEATGAAPGDRDDERRRYYRITRDGRQAARQQLARLDALVRAGQSAGLHARSRT